MIQCPRGTRDFLPDELEKRRFYENRLRHTARTFGFREVETPIFEDAELFILRSGPNVLKELYAFEDKGGRQIALRPEMTAPVVRMFVNNMSNEPKPIKVFYFGQCFRYERPQSGRYREFFQFGAEIIGSATPETDAEAIALAYAMIGQIGVKNYRIRIGHIGVLRQRIADAGVPAERTAEVLQKLDKKLYDEARPLMEDMGVKADDIDDIFSLTETVGGVEVLDRVPGEAGDWLRQVVAYLKVMGVEDLEIDLGTWRSTWVSSGAWTTTPVWSSRQRHPRWARRSRSAEAARTPCPSSSEGRRCSPPDSPLGSTGSCWHSRRRAAPTTPRASTPTWCRSPRA